jgi:hypothetical protein
MTLGALSQAWIAAEAALPLGWLLVGVWRDAETPDTWNAVAAGPIQPADMETGRGLEPVQALRRLADSLRERSSR